MKSTTLVSRRLPRTLITPAMLQDATTLISKHLQQESFHVIAQAHHNLRDTRYTYTRANNRLVIIVAFPLTCRETKGHFHIYHVQPTRLSLPNNPTFELQLDLPYAGITIQHNNRQFFPLQREAIHKLRFESRNRHHT